MLGLRLKDSDNHLIVDKKLIVPQKRQNKIGSLSPGKQQEDNSRAEFKRLVINDIEISRQIFGGKGNTHESSNAQLDRVAEEKSE